MKSNLVFLDTETTGNDLEKDRLCQVAYKSEKKMTVQNFIWKKKKFSRRGKLVFSGRAFGIWGNLGRMCQKRNDGRNGFRNQKFEICYSHQ